MPAHAAGTALRSSALTALLGALSLHGAAAAERDFEIGYHERVSLPRGVAAPHLSFIAHGRQFDLELSANNAILAPPDAAADARVTLYRGRLNGQADSWVRLSDNAGRLTGAIYDGSELWLLDTQANVASYFENPEPHSDATVMFRLSEVGGTFGDIVATQFDATAVDDVNQPLTPLPFVPSAGGPAQAGRVLDIALVASAEFSRRHGAAARDVLLETFNIVEGIFLTQAGVQLRAAEIVVLDTDPLSLRSTDAVLLLDRFGAFKARTPALRELGLAHLFVARDLADIAPPVRTVGIANLGTVCSERYGVGITEAVHSTVFDALITAHEIGHNFGAPHDAEPGSVCAGESASHIMAPQIGGSAQFSQCSLEQVRLAVAAAACLREMPPADLQLRVAAAPPASVRIADELELELELANLSSTRVAGLTLSAGTQGLSTPALATRLPGDGRCEQRQKLECVWPWFEAGSTASLRLTMSGTTPGPGTITVTVGSLNELDTSDNLLRFEIEVLPRNLLAGRLSPATIVLSPGDSGRFAAGVANYGTQTVTNVVARLQSDRSELEIVDVALPNCVPATAPDSRICSIGTLGPRSLRNFTVTVRVPQERPDSAQRSGSATITLTATAEAPAGTAEHVVAAEVAIGSVTENPGQSTTEKAVPATRGADPADDAATNQSAQSGGGGSDLLALLALACGYALRRRFAAGASLSR